MGVVTMPVLGYIQLLITIQPVLLLRHNLGVEPTLPDFVPKDVSSKPLQEDQSKNKEAGESVAEYATFRIVPLQSETSFTFGEDLPTKKDFPKHIVEKSILDNNSNMDNRSKLVNEARRGENIFRSLPDIYDPKDFFPTGQDKTNKQSDKYKSTVGKARNGDNKKYYFEPTKQIFLPTVRPKVIPKNLRQVSNISKPSLTPIHSPQSREAPKEKKNAQYSVAEKSYKTDQISSPSYSYAYSVNGGSYGPVFAKQENSDGYLTKGEYSVALPDGRLQTVSYTVEGDKGGYSASVHYTGKARHPHTHRQDLTSHPQYLGLSSEPLTQREAIPQKFVKYVPHKSFQD